MEITVYAMCYNESVMLPIFVAHYRERFPKCRIVIWDNNSTDGSQELARSLGCEVRPYESGGELRDSRHSEIKDTSWKTSPTAWSCVVDMDELCDITEAQLLEEDRARTSHIKFQGYDMISQSEDPDHTEATPLTWGKRNTHYDKTTFINRERIKEINWVPGCHNCFPTGTLRLQKGRYRMYHNKYIGLNWLLEKHRYSRERLSEENIKQGWGVQYQMKEDEIRREWDYIKSQSVKLK